MVFHKVVKNKAYFKRFQTKFRRRREGKTDYHARKRLVVQAKNKYASPKYRLVVRFSNKFVLCQVVFATMEGDRVLAAATSAELPRYGVKVGLKNYAASYATGLLVARRTLQKLGLDSTYEGVDEATGEYSEPQDFGGVRKFYVSELDDEMRPFRANLDVGIAATTTGAKVFGALKGAVDGGLDIPHSPKRFPGFDAESGKYSAEAHREKIFGGHVADYMRQLEESEPEVFRARFSKFIEAGVTADSLEGMYSACHAAIRADPSSAAKSTYTPDASFKNRAKASLAQRKARVAQKKAARARKLLSQRAAAVEEESEEEEED